MKYKFKCQVQAQKKGHVGKANTGEKDENLNIKDQV